jgi:hypothetical protein
MPLRPGAVSLLFALLGPPLGYVASFAIGAGLRLLYPLPMMGAPLEGAVSQYGFVAVLGIYLIGAPTALLAAFVYLLLFWLYRRFTARYPHPYLVGGAFGACAGAVATGGLLILLSVLVQAARANAVSGVTVGMLLFLLQGLAAGLICGLASTYIQRRADPNES